MTLNELLTMTFTETTNDHMMELRERLLAKGPDRRHRPDLLLH